MGRETKKKTRQVLLFLRQEADRFGRLKLVPNFFSPTDTKSRGDKWMSFNISKEDVCCAALVGFFWTWQWKHSPSSHTLEILSCTGQRFKAISAIFKKKLDEPALRKHLWPQKFMIFPYCFLQLHWVLGICGNWSTAVSTTWANQIFRNFSWKDVIIFLPSHPKKNMVYNNI